MGLRAAKDLGTVLDETGNVHHLHDDGVDPRSRSRTRRFELRGVDGISAEALHATMAVDGFYDKSKLVELEGAVGFVDIGGNDPRKTG